MRVLITGGGGFIGKKLAAKLLSNGTLAGQAITKVTVADIAPAEGLADDTRLEIVTLNMTDKAAVDAAVAQGVDTVFHLAAIVSGNAEADTDLGYAVNLDGTRYLLEALRHAPNVPKILFASSCAVYGGDVPDPITDQTFLNPQTSYGAQKAAGELFVTDYSRKGFVDGLSLRLPTIMVRPGKPNKAASTFASSIIREPLAGQEAVLPVRDDNAMFILSPRRVVDAFIHAAELDRAKLGMTRAFVLNGITVTVGEMIAGLREVAGNNVVARIKRVPDATIQTIVDGWPPNIEAGLAKSLGFEADSGMAEIVRAHIEDELGGTFAA